MAMLGLQEKVKELEFNLVRLDESVVQDIVKASEKVSNPGHPETAHWFYSMPFPGVRYYHYEDLLI